MWRINIYLRSPTTPVNLPLYKQGKEKYSVAEILFLLMKCLYGTVEALC
jgi:hypothetical protein